MFDVKNKNERIRGFTLIEIIIGVAVFVLVSVGVYSSIQFVFKVVYQSRIRIIETSVLNEQIEIIRNMNFHDVGILNGSPAGLLERTVTTTRNSIEFEITRTIRNIDDDFDGTVGGDPNDLSPADYKLVEVEIVCAGCDQREPLTMTTYIGPKYLEGDPTHGALFVEVFDANAQPVQGASVHIVSTLTDPAYDFTDVTDNDGMLRIVDLVEGVQAYDIVVSKAGYTSAQTITPSAENLNPTKLPASVVAQDVTEISFSIDEVSSMNVSSINQYCNAVGSVSTHVFGTHLVGTEPDVYIVSTTIATDGSGEYTFADMHWDNYMFNLTGYDLIGTIPNLSVYLPAGSVQPVQLITGPNYNYSLLVNILDSVTGQPISNASVVVTSTGYNENKITGIGFSNQTDWSGGDGQLDYIDQTLYWSQDGGMEDDDPEGDLKLKLVGESYVSDSELESSIFDLGTSVNFVNLIWTSLSQPLETGDDPVLWQLATSNTSTPETWDYLGSDGTGATYYDDENISINDIHDGDRYFRYKLFLATASTTYTPTISDVSVTYTTECTPPGQVYFGNLSEQSYSIVVSAEGYSTITDTADIDGDIIMEVNMVAN